MQSKRLARSYEDHYMRIAQGEAYSPSIYGRPPKIMGKPGSREYRAAEAAIAEEEREIGHRWSKAMVPKDGEVRGLIKPALVSNAPTWENEHASLPPDATPEQKETALWRRRRCRVYEELAKVIYREFKCHEGLGLAVDDAMQFGKGALVTDWNGDVINPLCGFKYVSIKRVLVDSETVDDPLGENIRWKAVCYTVPLGDAEKLAELYENPGYEFRSATTDVFADDSGLREAPTRFVKLIYVYVHGDSPHLRDSRMSAETDEEVEPVGADDVYDGRDHILVMEAKGELDDQNGYSLIARLDPMYPNDLGEDPLTLFSLDPDNEDYWGKPVYQKGHSLQVAINWAVRYYNTNAYLTAKGAIGLVKGAMDPSEEEKLLARTEPQPIVHFADQTKLQQGFRPLELGKPASHLIPTMEMDSALYDSVMSADLFRGIGKSHETAARAMLSSERAQLVIGRMADQVEQAITTAMRKALMACRAKMTAEQVAAWIGVEYLYFEPRVDEDTGEEVLWSPIWNDEVNDIQAIRMEVDVRIKPRSVRFTSPEQRLQDMDRFGGKMSEMLGKVLEAVGLNHPTLAAEIAAKGNAYLRDYGNLLGLPNVDELAVDLAVAATPAMPPPAPPGEGMEGGEAPGVPGAAGPTGPAVPSMVNVLRGIGADASAVPGELGEQARRAGA